MVELRTLRVLTFVAGVAHFVQAIVILLLTMRKDTSIHLEQNFVVWPENTTLPFEYDSVSGGSLDLKFLIVAFFFLSFLFQFVPAASGRLWRYFIGRLLSIRGIQPLRWFEYAASASCLLLVCAAVNGITDLHFMLLIFFANATVMLLGFVQEVFAYLYNKRSELDKLHEMVDLDDERFEPREPFVRNFIEFAAPHLIGWMLYIPLWTILLVKFAFSVANSSKSPPNYVYALFVCNIIVFTSFGLVQLVEMTLIYRKPYNIKKYALNAELAYTILSLLAKSFTAWFFFGGVLASSAFAKQ